MFNIADIVPFLLLENQIQNSLFMILQFFFHQMSNSNAN